MSSSTPPTQDQLAAARAARSSNGYLLLGFLLTFLPSPYSAAAIVPLVMSVIGAARTLVALRRLGAPRPVQVTNYVGLGLTVLLLLTIAAPLVAGSNDGLEACLAGANTNTATQACHDKFGDSGFWSSLFG